MQVAAAQRAAATHAHPRRAAQSDLSPRCAPSVLRDALRGALERVACALNKLAAPPGGAGLGTAWRLCRPARRVASARSWTVNARCAC